MSPKQAQKILSAILVLIFALIFNFSSPKINSPKKPKEESVSVKTNTVEPNDAVFVRAVDGDTIVVKLSNKEEKVRLIGINSPESVDPRRKVECFGKEASAEIKKLLTAGQVISLESDASQNDLDKYGRLLRYAYFSTNASATSSAITPTIATTTITKEIFLNKYMIENGYAYEYTYEKPYKYEKEFKSAEIEARIQKRGLWADNACANSR